VPDTHLEWNRVLALLDRDDVITPDMPGFGVPTPDGFGATKEEYADWLVAELEAIGEPVDLVGHDWGAHLVQRALATRPELLRTCAFGGCALDPSYVWHDTAQMWQTPEVGEQVVAAMTPELLATALPGSGIPADVAAAIGTQIDDTMRTCILALYRSAVDVYTEWSLPSPSPVPTLVIAGTQDPYIGPSHHEYAAKLTGAELLMLDCNHWWPLERPTEVAAALQRLWASA
jgi:pimeloyl-ACP methyl ester carboxylesterase